jgi:tryptophan synthase alpha chain
VSRLASVFGSRRKALMPYLMLGDGDAVALAAALAAAGADVLELGVPFSDPLADGPVIQAAGQRALRAGFRVADAFRLATEIRARTDAALALMTYVNPVLQAGPETFVARAAEAGVDALVVPDLPAEEADGLAGACGAAGLDLVRFVAPTSPDDRIRAIVEGASGFVYCVSVTGVTGARESLSERAAGLLARVRRFTRLPLCLGFGISGPETAAEAARLADGVIVGSAVVRAHAEGGPAAAANLVAAMRQAVDRAVDSGRDGS